MEKLLLDSPGTFLNYLSIPNVAPFLLYNFLLGFLLDQLELSSAVIEKKLKMIIF